jgi:hypothetical protein
MMSEPDELLFNSDSELEEEPLGLKEPLGIIQQFIVPLGANALTVLDPSIFLHGEIQEDSFRSSVQDSPLFAEFAPAMQGEVQFEQRQTVDRANAENALGETIQRQEFEVETPSLSLHSPPSPPILGGSDPQNPLRLGSPELHSPPELGDLGGDRNVFATFQTASEMAQSASDSLESSDQSVPLPENPSTEPQSVENPLTNSASTTVRTQETEASEMGRPSEVVQVRSPRSEQNGTPHSSEDCPDTNISLQEYLIHVSEDSATQSLPIAGDLGGDRKVLDTSQTSPKKENDRDNAEIIERSQISDPATSPNIDPPIQQKAVQPFPEVNPNHSNPFVQAQTYESKVIEAPLDPPIDSPVSLGDPSQNLLEPTSSSLDLPHSVPLAVASNPPILNVAASDRTNAAIESTDFRAPITEPTIQRSRSDSVVQWEFSSSESTETTIKEPFVSPELSSSQQKIEVGESEPETIVMRSPQPPETLDAISPQGTPHAENIEQILLQPRLDDSALAETESSILPESPNVTSPEIEPLLPLPTDFQANAQDISAQKSAETNASSKANPKSLLSKTIQFLSKAIASIVTTPKQKSSSEASRQIQSSLVQTDSIQQFEERPSQSLQTQEEPTLSKSPMIVESPLIQSETRLPEIPIQHSVPEERRSPEAETLNQKTPQAEIRSPEAEAPTPQLFRSDNPSPKPLIEQFVQPETRSPEADLAIQRSIQVEGRSTELFIERSIQSEAQLPEAETPIQPSVQAKEQTPVTETLIQHSIQLEEQLLEAETPIQSFVQTEGRSPDTFIETSFQADAESSEADSVIQRSVQAEGPSPEGETSIEEWIQTEEQSPEVDAAIQLSTQDDMRSEVDLAIQKSTQDDTRSLDTETPIHTEIQSTETPIQHPVEIDARPLEIDSPTQNPIHAEGQTQELETLNEQSIQAEARSTKTSIQRSVRADTLFADTLFLEEATPTQQSVQAETLSLETPTEQSVQPEVRSPKIESLLETPVQSESQSFVAETPIPQAGQVEAQSLEVNSEIQRSVQPKTRSSETPIPASVQTEGRSPETLIESSAQLEIQSLVKLIQASAQAEEQTPETLIQRSIQLEEQLSEAETPIQQPAQAETRSPEAESSIQETVQIEGRSTSIDSPIQRVVQPPTHETIQPPQYPNPLSQPENEDVSELIASDTEKVQPISPSELAIARKTTSEPLSETAIAPHVEGQTGSQNPAKPVEQDSSSLRSPPKFPILGDFEQLDTQIQRSDRVKVQNEEQLGTSRILKASHLDSNDFPQLPSVLQNLSILKALAQNTVQKISEQSYASSYPPIIEGKQTQNPPELVDLRGQRRVLATSQISPQELIAANSIVTVQKSPTEYPKIDIPPRKPKMAEVRSQSTPSIAIAPKTTIQTKQQNPSDIIQMAQTQTLIPEGKEEIPLETDTSASDIAQDLETLAQTIYVQLQQRLRIDRERQGHGTGRFPW